VDGMIIRVQGYFVVVKPVAGAVGFRGDPSSRLACFSSGLPSNAERVCEWDFPVCGGGFQEMSSNYGGVIISRFLIAVVSTLSFSVNTLISTL
jgi:hypothetical protein